MVTLEELGATGNKVKLQWSLLKHAPAAHVCNRTACRPFWSSSLLMPVKQRQLLLPQLCSLDALHDVLQIMQHQRAD